MEIWGWEWFSKCFGPFWNFLGRNFFSFFSPLGPLFEVQWQPAGWGPQVLAGDPNAFRLSQILFFPGLELIINGFETNGIHSGGARWWMHILLECNPKKIEQNEAQSHNSLAKRAFSGQKQKEMPLIHVKGG